jgi:type IV secretory pathway VirB9-like protein
MMRRRGRPLLRAAATTAVVAGTAGAVRHRQDMRYEQQAANQQAQAQAEYDQQAALAQQAAAQAAAQQAPTGGGLNEEIRQLAELHQSGALTDQEFAAAKSKLLSGG